MSECIMTYLVVELWVIVTGDEFAIECWILANPSFYTQGWLGRPCIGILRILGCVSSLSSFLYKEYGNTAPPK